MQSVMSGSALRRRMAAGAVVALSAATLSLGVGGPAHADTTVTDLKGTVTGVGGAALEGIHVEVFNATTGASLETLHTDAGGHYDFTDLEFDGNVKVLFEDHNDFQYTDTNYYVDRYYGGSKFLGNATPLAITTDGGKVLNFVMTPAAIITGTVAAPDGHAFTDSFGIDVLDSDFNYPDYAVAADAPDGKSFKIATEPGVVRVGAYGWDDNAVGPDTFYAETWWVNADTPAAATPVTAPGFGQTLSGINLRPSNVLTARQAPQVSGFAAVGRALSATPGTWNRNAGTEFSYTWMRGATVVGTGSTYTPTVADLGQRLNVVVRALNGTNAGQAASAQTDPVRYPADAKGKAKALTGHKVRFAVKIVSAKQSPVRGKVVVLRGTKVVHKAVKLVKGKAVIIVKGQPKGKQTFTVLYKGNKVLAKASKNFTVRVR
jgi:hypothetical protein